ncbi:hypothetical protein Lal_00004958 [Lupinus albus]|nr:hypothetical protein Lal_00004958 [Lupinus albus]
MRWRRASSVICDRNVSLKLNKRFYRTIIRFTMLHGTECWTVKCQQDNKLKNSILPLEAPIRRLDQKEVSPISRDWWSPRKSKGEMIKKDLEINALSINMIDDISLWCRSIHVTDPPNRTKA